MAFDFPNSPTVGQIYSVSGGPSYVYNGTAWVVATAGSQFNRTTFTATAGQTTFTLNYVIGAIDVFRNGVKLVNGTDFTATNATSIILADACTLGDTIEVISYGQVTYSDAVKKSGDTMVGALTTPMVVTDSSMMFRNKIINGAMEIDQRYGGASTTSTGGAFPLDRWRDGSSVNSKFTIQRNAGSVTPPAGFTNYMGITSSSAYTPGSSEYFFMGQRIEGYNGLDFAWGTASAKAATLSFWVRSSLTGIFGGAIQAGKSYTFSYTINASNTWEYKTITIGGDTTTAPPSTTTGKFAELIFSLGAGSTQETAAGVWTSGGYVAPPGTVDVVATNGATWYITGVQFEVGSVATPFERRNYATEFQLCQRYFQRFRASNEGYLQSGSNTSDGVTFNTAMRTAPSTSYTVRQAGNTNSNPFSYLSEIWGLSTYIGTNGGNYNWHVDGNSDAEI